MKNGFCLMILVLGLYSCNKKQETTKPVKESITESVYASGLVKSRDQYQVFSPVNGLIKEIYVTEGDTVKKDQPILQVKSDIAQLNVENAKLASENANVNANLNKLNEIEANISFLLSKIKNDSLLLVRQRNLWADEIGTRNEVEQRELALKNDRAQYDAALSHFRDLQKTLNYTSVQSNTNLKISEATAGDFTLKSQFNGRVYSISKEKGEMVTTQTPIAVIGGVSDFIIELQVDEYDIEKIKYGQKIHLSMDSYKKRIFEATVVRILPYMNERTRSFTVEARFTSAPPALFPNLTVEANILIQAKDNAVTIPVDYLLNDSTVIVSGNQERKVTTGLKDYRKVEITSGLSPADEIIKPGK